MNKSIKIGIMGGTFNPIHFGHLILAENAFDYFKLDSILFIPTGDPPHKEGQSIISKEHRLRMTQLAIEDNHHFDLSKTEITRKGYSYTVDTLEMLKKENERHHYYFIIGSDALYQITSWRNPEQLFKLCDIIVAARDDVDQEDLLKKKKEIFKQFKGNIHLLPMPKIDISSSIIRQRVKEGATIKYFVPKDIEHYIYFNQLYQD